MLVPKILGMPVIARMSILTICFLVSLFIFTNPAMAHERHDTNSEVMQSNAGMESDQGAPSDFLPSCCHFGLSASMCGPGACIINKPDIPGQLNWQRIVFLQLRNPVDSNLASPPPTPPPVFL